MGAEELVCYWTPKMNKLFEVALAMYDEDTPNRWEVIADIVGGGTTPEEVESRYHILVHDLQRIEMDQVPLPDYHDEDDDNDDDYYYGEDTSDEEQRLKELELDYSN
ncbi:Protein RADIALIS-like 1 [Linum grandiflorum]